MNPLQPLVVSYGVGVDSTALLVGLHKRGIRPDAILFADVGAEKPETYAYLATIGAWLERVGFPALTTVRYVPETAPYSTLTDKCLVNETLPSLAYGGHSCSLVFKVAPQDKWLGAWAPAQEAWQEGLRVTKAIGYDSGTADCRRSTKARKANAKQEADVALHNASIGPGSRKKAQRVLWDYWYPLQEWGWDRVDCLREIEAAGLPVPMKSACFFCPASKKSEVVWLRDKHPELFATALDIERRALVGPRAVSRELDRKAKCEQAGEKYRAPTTVGLGRTFAWASLVEVAEVEAEEEDAILQP
jgi:hypothetical protein